MFKNLPKFSGRLKAEKLCVLNQVIRPKVKLFCPRKFPFSRFIVDDESMLPNFKPGDHVLTFNWGRAEIRDVLVFKSKDKFYIKRVDKVSGRVVYVSGDNKNESSKIGPIDEKQIIGKVIWKY